MGGNKTVYRGDAWIDTYIFPGGMLPSGKQIGEATEEELVIEDWHNFGLDYTKTLHAWLKNFRANWHLLQGRYDERFRRLARILLQQKNTKLLQGGIVCDR
jgi:cyclopropane-fatty-acyl-phospholipid synthase